MTGHALFLDLDGTLADSLAVLHTAYVGFLARFNLPGDQTEFSALNGPPTADVVRTLQQGRRLPGSHDQLLKLYLSSVEEAYVGVRPMKGGRALLTAARDRGWGTAVVTSSTSELAWAWLRATHLDQAINAVVGGDMVQKGKPNPEPYFAALRAVRASPLLSIAIEDSPQGAAAAIAAGIRTFLFRPADAVESSSTVPGIAGTIGRLQDVLEFMD